MEAGRKMERVVRVCCAGSRHRRRPASRDQASKECRRRGRRRRSQAWISRQCAQMQERQKQCNVMLAERRARATGRRLSVGAVWTVQGSEGEVLCPFQHCALLGGGED